MITASSIANGVRGCDGFLCCIGTASLVPGLVQRVVSQVAFFPPRPAGYTVAANKHVFLVDAENGLEPLPNCSPMGIAVDTVRMWTTRGNEILGFHFRRADSRYTILFSHGNSTDIGIMFHHFAELSQRLNVDVFAYEYSGYGESTGEPSEANLYADIDAAYTYLIDDCGIEEHLIVLCGQSVGSVPSIDLASRSVVGGLILHSALKSGLSVIHEVQTMYWFDVFKNETKIQNVRSPTFIIHGTHDVEVPFEHGMALYEACPEELAYDPWWVKEGGHNDIDINYREEYFARIHQFLVSLATDGDLVQCSGLPRPTSLTGSESPNARVVRLSAEAAVRAYPAHPSSRVV